MDKFKVGVTDATLNKLEEAGFQISMPIVSAEINSMDQPFNVRVMVRTPKNQGWTDEYHTLEFFAESVFSCQHETTGCNRMTQPITIYVARCTFRALNSFRRYPWSPLLQQQWPDVASQMMTMRMTMSMLGWNQPQGFNP